LSENAGEESALGIEPKIQGWGIRRAAALMHEARGKRAAKEAAARALAHRLRGDDAGFDVWSWISAAIRALEKRRPGNDGG
jgi:hypothetical protein